MRKVLFPPISSPAELEEHLLYGGSFKDVQHISEDGLNEFYNLLSRYGSDSSYVFAVKRPRKKKAAVNPEVEALRKDKEKQERALKRLQDLYLYSERAMTEKISSYRRMKYPPGFRILTPGSVWLRTMLIHHVQMRILYGKQATSSLRKNLLVENIFIINPWRRLFLLVCSRYTWKLF